MLQEMYYGFINSIETVVINAITDTDTVIYVQDDTRIPDAPNLLVIGGNLASAETVKLLEKDGGKLTVQRAFQGTAKNWAANTVIARNYTEYDHRAFIQNINESVSRIEGVENSLTQKYNDALILINELNTKITILEKVFFGDITSNPFMITFDTLDGIKAAGVWNAQLQRIEC